MIKTRIAPSPTGNFHVGTARTALFNYLFARHHGGKFLLRIEDTDYERSKKKFEEDIIEGLTWLKIEWDETIIRQSEHREVYATYLHNLLETGKAFYCPHTEKKLEEEKNGQIKNKAPLLHRCDARDKLLDKGVIRFKNNEKLIKTFDDIIKGQVGIFPAPFGDFVLAKNTRTPLYNFAVVVDDHETRISHVIRGEDHLPNTPKQILIQEALGFARPQYAHLPLLLGADRSKLSKRHGATSIQEYRDEGYLADALFNFLALLGWNPGTEQEVFSRTELVELFSLDRVQKSGAIFDIVKLNWMNNQYIGKTLPEKLTMLATPYISNLLQNQKSKIKMSI